MPVLYGVLLYMGVASLKGMQFIERLGLFFMPPKYQPDYNYLRHVPLKQVHLFTFIQVSYFLFFLDTYLHFCFSLIKNVFFPLQVLALGILWALKSTKASLGFPLMVLGLVGFRKLMDYTPKIFSQRDLFWLDNLMPSSNDKKDDEESEENIQKV